MIDCMTAAMVRMENAFREPLAAINRKLRTREALGHLARKRTHQFIEQRLAARFRFTPLGIRGAVCHEIEMASATRRTPRFALAPPRLTGATSKPFAQAK